MFEKLKSALSSLSSSISQKTLDEKEVDKIISDFELALVESDVAFEIVKELTERVKNMVVGVKIQRSIPSAEYVKDQLSQIVRGVFSKGKPIDFIEAVRTCRIPSEPFVIVFLGINGTGKTTTIAKFAYMLKNNGFKVVLACADTHRAGAIEQLSEHAKRLSVKIISQKYGADPAAVARDAVLYAKNHDVDVVLVDTAGRMQTSRNLMEEMSKIIRVVKPDLKVFVADSLAGNDAVSQAEEFQSFTKFDTAVLTKAEADVKGGAALSIAYITGKPMSYLGVGQGYNDLIAFDVDKFVENLFHGNGKG